MIENLLIAFCIGILVAGWLIIIRNIVDLIKNEFTYINHTIIACAIHKYHMHLIEEGLFDRNNIDVTYEDMEDYDTTQERFWDWGYTRILPPEKFELIKPFINR